MLLSSASLYEQLYMVMTSSGHPMQCCFGAAVHMYMVQKIVILDRGKYPRPDREKYLRQSP